MLSVSLFVALFTPHDLPKHVFRGSSALYFLFTSLAGLVILAFRDLVGGEDISLALSLVPAAFLGKILGTAFLKKCNKLSAFSYRLFKPRAFLPAL